jgi:anti-sigma B factor antagonist
LHDDTLDQDVYAIVIVPEYVERARDTRDNQCEGEGNMNKHFRVDRHADVLAAHFLDKSIHADLAISSLGDELYAIVGRPDCLKLVLNFSNVEFLSSAMLGKLLSAKKMMAEKGSVLRLCEICTNIRMIFTVTHLDHILDIRDTEAGAVEP